ncbi:hypothetical protein ACA910_017254 [Epithemia clementina (nom. ined.)]
MQLPLHSSRGRATPTAHGFSSRGTVVASTSSERQSMVPNPEDSLDAPRPYSLSSLGVSTSFQARSTQLTRPSGDEISSQKRSRDFQQQETENSRTCILGSRPAVAATSYGPHGSANNEAAAKKTRSSKYNARPIEKSKNLLSVMGTLAQQPSSNNVLLKNSKMEQIPTRRRLSGGAIESYLADQQKMDDMDTDSVGSGRPRSMSF